MSARDLWLKNRVQRRYHCRYYAGIPFTEALDPAVHDSVAGALQSVTVAKPGGERAINADAVDVTEAYALVEFTHSPADGHRAGHVAGQFVQALNEWADANGYLRGLHDGYEWGTLSPPPLALGAGTERVADRLATWHADEAPTSDPAEYHYALATPDTAPTDEEHEALVYAADSVAADVTVTDAGALLIEALDYPREDLQRLTDCVRRVDRPAAVETDLGNWSAWDYELGTLGQLDEAAREALRTRAADLAPDPNPDADTDALEAETNA